MKFREIGDVVDASLWNKNGDHPEDDVMRPFEDTGAVPSEPREGKVVRYFRRPNVPGTMPCPKCSVIMHEHGWIDEPGLPHGGPAVCPGDWVVTFSNGLRLAYKPDAFKRRFELVPAAA